MLARANVAAAKGVLIDARDDNEAVTLTVAAEQAAPEVHTMVALRDLSRRRTIHRVNSTVQCVEWHATALITEELVDPGLTAIYQELMGPENKNTYSTVVPDAAADATYGGWQRVLGEQHDATVLAVREDGAFDVSAAWTRSVPAGATLFYIADRRLTPDELAQAARAI